MFDWEKRIIFNHYGVILAEVQLGFLWAKINSLPTPFSHYFSTFYCPQNWQLLCPHASELWHHETQHLRSHINSHNYIPYTYKISRDVNFTDDPNLGFQQLYFCRSLVITPCTSSVQGLFYKILRS